MLLRESWGLGFPSKHSTMSLLFTLLVTYSINNGLLNSFFSIVAILNLFYDQPTLSHLLACG